MALWWSIHLIPHMAVYKPNQIFYQNELFWLCLKCLERIQTTVKQINKFGKLTADQANNESGEWMMLWHKCVTASSFGDVIKRREWTSFGPLII